MTEYILMMFCRPIQIIIIIGQNLLEVFQNVTGVRFSETQCIYIRENTETKYITELVKRAGYATYPKIIAIKQSMEIDKSSGISFDSEV